METIKTAIFGDNFMLSQVFQEALESIPGHSFEVTSRDLEWPDVPFHQGGGPAGDEISEYSGAPEDLFEMVSDAEVLVTHLAPVTKSLIDAAPKLRFIGVSRGGPVNINVKAAKERGIAVVNAPGRNASAVAEFTIGAILAETRVITTAHMSMARGEWRGDLYRADRTGRELSELTVGIIGYSHIGQRIVRLLKPFGCRILVCDPYVRLSIQDEVEGVRQVDLDTLIRESDVVTLHVRVTNETKNIISAERIAAMKQGAYLINTARGSLVDQDALVAALSSGKLRGAALDTFATEPPAPDDPILSLPNVTLTPHIAGASVYVTRFAANVIARDLENFLHDQPLTNAC